MYIGGTSGEKHFDDVAGDGHHRLDLSAGKFFRSGDVLDPAAHTTYMLRPITPDLGYSLD